VKNYRFPHRASRTSGFFRSVSGIRTALILAFVVSLASLPFYVLAQTDSAPVKTSVSASYRPAPEGGVFVIARGADGKSECRQATVDSE